MEKIGRLIFLKIDAVRLNGQSHRRKSLIVIRRVSRPLSKIVTLAQREPFLLRAAATLCSPGTGEFRESNGID
jgi:hypothetical protein